MAPRLSRFAISMSDSPGNPETSCCVPSAVVNRTGRRLRGGGGAGAAGEDGGRDDSYVACCSAGGAPMIPLKWEGYSWALSDASEGEVR